MDAAWAAEHACRISQFVVTCSDVLSRVRASKLEKLQPVLDERPNNLMETLLQHTRQVHFTPSDGAATLSREDEILLRLAGYSQEYSSQLMEAFQDWDTEPKNLHATEAVELQHNQDLTNLLQSIKQLLNDDLAALQWSSTSQTIRELGAKNSRLGANRTVEIQQLAAEVDTSFQAITSKQFDDVTLLRSWQQVHAATQRVTDLSVEQTVLTMLQFWTMDRRKELIGKEHDDTFEWVLAPTDPNQSKQSSSNFSEWLEIDEPLYWISGKPGSGKSTLMKFLAENPKTIQALKRWAKDDTLITAVFYFWSSAKDPLQKSDTGLLRSILFQILRQCPDLVQYAYPEQWRERHHSHGSLQQLVRSEQNTSGLIAAFTRVSDALSSVNAKFCFFIDGLDEYDGEPTDVICLVEALNKSVNLKTCVSSRQWADFEKTFGTDSPWKLYIHEMTENDMVRYVEDLLGKDPKFCQMREAADAGSTHSLVKAIVENAEGVFLWSFLVVRDLLDGLSETDTIHALQQRLGTIPTDLDGYFKKLFQDTQPHMRDSTAKVFEVTLNAVDKLPLMCYWFIQQHGLEDVQTLKLESMETRVANQNLREMEKLLNIYSQGLLSANISTYANESTAELEDSSWLFEFRVDFIHRTVADFMQTADMKKLLKKWMPQSFNVDVEICKASLATIKATPSTRDMFQDAHRALSILNLFMCHVKMVTGDLQTDLVDGLLAALRLHTESINEMPMMVLGAGNFWAYQCSFNFALLYHCVSYGLTEYVALQLDKESMEFAEPQSGLLYGCFSWDSRVRMERFALPVDTVEMLLARGLDPNLPWGDRGFSFWQQLLTSTYSRHLKGIADQGDFDAIKCAVEHGADMESRVEVFAARRMGETKAREIVERVVPIEQLSALRLDQSERPYENSQ